MLEQFQQYQIENAYTISGGVIMGGTGVSVLGG